MKTPNYQKLTTYEIPGGEGSTALPISFINVIARAVGFDTIVSKPSPKQSLEGLLRHDAFASFLAMTINKR